MNQHRTETKVLISALRTLSEDIYSEDGVANACIAEAADRIEELESGLLPLTQGTIYITGEHVREAYRLLGRPYPFD